MKYVYFVRPRTIQAAGAFTLLGLLATACGSDTAAPGDSNAAGTVAAAPTVDSSGGKAPMGLGASAGQTPTQAGSSNDSAAASGGGSPPTGMSGAASTAGTANGGTQNGGAGAQNGGAGGAPPQTGGFRPKSAKCKLVLDEGFDEHPGAFKPYTEAMVQQEWAGTSGYKGLDGRTLVGNSVIQAFYPKGKILGQVTGFTWFTKLSDTPQEAIMEYKLKFEKGFDWTKGGKLPGLCGGTCPRGCTDDSTGGFTTRLMWQRDAGMIVYAYYPTKDKDQNNCGEHWDFSKTIADDTWVTLRQHVKLNTPGQFDGALKMYMDGQLVQTKDDALFRLDDKVAIDFAYITTYVGGSSVADFAPDHDQHVQFDSFKVWTGCYE